MLSYTLRFTSFTCYSYTLRKANARTSTELWAVVGNAGVCYAGELEWGNLDWLTRTFDINVIGLVRCVLLQLFSKHCFKFEYVVDKQIFDQYSL